MVFFLEVVFLAVDFFAVVFFFAVAMAASLQYLFTMNIAQPVSDELASAPMAYFVVYPSMPYYMWHVNIFFASAFHHSVFLVPRIPRG